MENIYSKVTKALEESTLGCPVQKLKRDESAKQSISYLLHPSIPSEYSDNNYNYMEHEVQIDIWSDYEMSIQNLMNKTIDLMKNNGFSLLSIRADMYEPDTNLIHKPLLFSYVEKIKKESE